MVIMQKRKKTWLMIVLALFALLFFTTWYLFNKVLRLSLYETVAIEEEVAIDQSYEKIDLKTSNAKVEFIPTKAEETTVSYGGKKKWKMDFNVKVKEDTLTIQLKEKWFNFIDFSMKGLVLKVYVPEVVYREIKAKTDNGIIHASNLQANYIKLETDNGLIKLNNSEGEKVDIQTDNGQITVNEVNADINARTDNGRILFEATELNHHVNLKTDNGAIHVKLSTEPSNAKIEVELDNGSVNVFGTKERVTTFGEGKYLMRLETDNGRIHVE